MDRNANVDKELQAQCICEGCPSYIDCDEPLAYCLVGVSECIKNEQGCICEACPVYEKMKLDRLYFCIR